jgi:hypothetical protein
MKTKNKITCYCCGYKTLTEGPGEYDICPVCFWEDDGKGFIGSNEPSSANHGLRLSEAQTNFVKYGAASPNHKDNVRPPRANEPRDESWKPFDK